MQSESEAELRAGDQARPIAGAVQPQALATVELAHRRRRTARPLADPSPTAAGIALAGMAEGNGSRIAGIAGACGDAAPATPEMRDPDDGA